MEQINKDLLEILACPKCKASVKQEGEHIACANSACGLRYPIREGIPIMLIEEAEQAKEGKEGAG